MKHKDDDTIIDLETSLIIFKIKQHLLGLDISSMREVNKMFNFAPVPLAPLEIKGIINLRSVIITVVDLSLLLGLEPHAFSKKSHNIIFKEKHIALLVEDVLEVITIETRTIEEIPADFGGFEQRYLSGIVKFEEKLVLILSPTILMEYHKQ